MTDREIERLMRMAFEAEDLERSALAEPAPLRLVGGGARRWLAGRGMATAAAASLALAFFVMHKSVAPVPKGPLASAGNPSHPRESQGATAGTMAVSGTTDDQCVVMAVFRGADGQCSCLDLKEHEWANGRRLSQIDKRELLDVAMQAPCATNAHQVLVVAVEGKGTALPRSREQAEAIAARLADVPATNRHSDVSSYAYAAIPDLPPDATVVAEKLAVRPQVSATIREAEEWVARSRRGE
jgi:hypothetical protein